MIKQIDVIEVTQPIGTFYIGKIAARDLTDIFVAIRHSENQDGVQRDLKEKRVKEIAQYCDDPDATFPTPIIISVRTTKTERIISNKNTKGLVFEYDDETRFAEVLDGQHRIEGISKNLAFNYDLVIVIMFDLTKEEQAYVFSTINSNQVKVERSTIYDLFGLFLSRSPYKTCHEIARLLNSDENSPFYNRLKMLGKREDVSQSLSQGTFVNYLVKLISKDPEKDAIQIKRNEELKSITSRPFRKYFVENRDDIILKILSNYYSAISEVFLKEWTNPELYILSKTTGYVATILALKTFYKVGLEEKKLSQNFFVEQLSESRKSLTRLHLELTSTDFPSNSAGVKKLVKVLVCHLE